MNHQKYLSEIGRKGGIARAQKLTPEERKKISRKASYSLTKEERIARAKKANKASQLAKRLKKQGVHN
jgi:hypothetical protein